MSIAIAYHKPMNYSGACACGQMTWLQIEGTWVCPGCFVKAINEGEFTLTRSTGAAPEATPGTLEIEVVW